MIKSFYIGRKLYVGDVPRLLVHWSIIRSLSSSRITRSPSAIGSIIWWMSPFPGTWISFPGTWITWSLSGSSWISRTWTWALTSIRGWWLSAWWIRSGSGSMMSFIWWLFRRGWWRRTWSWWRWAWRIISMCLFGRRTWFTFMLCSWYIFLVCVSDLVQLLFTFTPSLFSFFRMNYKGICKISPYDDDKYEYWLCFSRPWRIFSFSFSIGVSFLGGSLFVIVLLSCC